MHAFSGCAALRIPWDLAGGGAAPWSKIQNYPYEDGVLV